MKIGILTFHWATNYGDILQCFALQTFLESFGHQVKVVNYKPAYYDDTFYKFIRYRKFLCLSDYIENYKKEKALLSFRSSNLKQTDRLYNCTQLSEAVSEFDVLITGSDQVMNPYFLMNGEGTGITPSYFLGFPFDGKKVAYAVSFGCVKYPEQERIVASRFMKDFYKISVRESSGIEIVKSMGRNDAVLVPDPTLLMVPSFYHALADQSTKSEVSTYVYNFFIRDVAERKKLINPLITSNNALWNNDDKDYTIQGWLKKIKQAEFVITDSFHCMVMCLKLHTPFAVVTNLEGNVGMNDRFYTLLGYLGLSDVILHKSASSKIPEIQKLKINWAYIDQRLEEYIQSGIDFLTL